MNTIKKSDSGTEEEKGIVESSVHHPVPRTTNDSVDVILSAEGGEKEPNSLSEMTCVYFDDLPVQRLMVGKFMEKVGFKGAGVFDTGVQFTSKCEFIKANRAQNKKVLSVEEIKQRFEWRKMKNADIIITDINDTDSVSDPSGGLRRGKMALEVGKIVVFVSGNVENGEIIDREFSEQYPGQYIFLAKPYEFTDIDNAIQTLIKRKQNS
ncbi:hypothetical protein KBB89_02670 [Candidatus Gracilibacteria bacterium]|nr:hypothetical protein [Candidatus Gracilibacteria bacterium]